MHKTTRAMSAALLVTLSLGLAAAPASSCSLTPESVSVDLLIADPGDTISASGTDIYWFNGPLGADCSGLELFVGTATLAFSLDGYTNLVDLGAVTVDDSSAFSTSLQIPASTVPGTYLLTLRIEGEPYQTSAQIVVRGVATTTTTAPPTTAAPPTIPPATPADPIDHEPTFTG